MLYKPLERRGAIAPLLVSLALGPRPEGYLENQSQEIGQIPGATVTQQQDRLLVRFPGDVLLSSGLATLSASAQKRLSAFAQTLNRYPESNLVVRGHTDSTRTMALNQCLTRTTRRRCRCERSWS